MKYISAGIKVSIVLLMVSPVMLSCKGGNDYTRFRTAISIPVEGNTWITDDPAKNKSMISDSGLTGWADTSTVACTWFKTEKTGQIDIALVGKVGSGRAGISCTLGGETRSIRIEKSVRDTLIIGTFNVQEAGYQAIRLKGLNRTGQTFGEIREILITGPATEGRLYYVKEDFYWGRRGPSVHLRYEIPEEADDIMWFYNEVTIPSGNDIGGSYFMADGFVDGYFGMQVNGPDERRILFSVWSPYKTDKPGDIPEESRIKLLNKGEDVHAGEFGNEGSGGQSYKKFMWKAETTYRFLIKGEPSAGNSTDYTAYFFAPEVNKWKLIASFRRPQTTRYLKSLYSFLENFQTETGFISRMGTYSNQWIITKSGKWFELSAARFTADNTAKKESRLDYAGGADNEGFFLRNCGFFNEQTTINTRFERGKTGRKPEINFKLLE